MRRPPRGVPKAQFASRDFYDTWLPELAPSAQLVGWFRHAQPASLADWASFARRYRREMRAPECARLLELLALLSRHGDFALGCYCEREDRCHRSLLAELLRERGAAIAP